MIAISCATCQKKLSVKEDAAGKKVKCPGCGQVTVVPAAVPAGSGNSENTPASSSPDALNAGNRPTHAPGSSPDATQGFDSPAQKKEKSLTDFLAPPQLEGELGRLGKYRILKVLGHGGMGVVYKAEDPKLKRTVAVKAMLPTLAASGSAGERFMREAEAMAQVEHDHIVRIYEINEDRGIPFMAMEFLKGEPLDERINRDNTLPLPEVLRIGREVARALDAAHKTGLIHRDIKPANIWLEAPEERVKILDFGLARAATQESGLTQQGAIIGTPAYMSPEQARGETVDSRCDLFSLGVVLYRLSTGQPPFQGKDTLTTVMAVAMHNPPAPVVVNGELPQEVSDLVMKLLDKDRDNRFQTAAEVVTAIKSIESGLGTSTMSDAKTDAPSAAPPKKAPAAPTLPPPSEKGTVADLPSASGRGAASDLPSPPGRGVGGEGPPRRRSKAPLVLAVAGLLAIALIAAAVVFFWSTANGIVRIEINDPTIQVSFDDKELIFKGLDKQDIKVNPGPHGLFVKRGDLEFTTDKFVLKKGETITLKIEWDPKGKLQVVHGDKVIGEKSRSAIAEEKGSGPFALKFDRNGEVSIPSVVLDQTGVYTLEAFVVPGELPGINELLGVNYQIALNTEDQAGSVKWRFTVCNNDDHLMIYGPPLERGKRVHVAGVWSGNEICLFLDGKRVAEKKVPRQNLLKPKEGNFLSLGRVYAGDLNEVRISKVARYDKDFTPAKRFEPDKDTVALYHFDEGEGDVLKDSSGNGHHGKIVGAKWVKGDGTVIAPTFKNSLGMEFVLVSKGKFWMGGGAGKPGDMQVEIAHDFYLGKYEVTQEEWEQVTGLNPSEFKAVAGVTAAEQKRFPVEQVSWDDCQAFVKLVNEKAKEAGWVYRLPTEAEWEYACRGGPTINKFDSGFDFYLERPSLQLGPDQANFSQELSLKRTCKVGSYPPNKLGLYDMHGNVWEWCDDVYKVDKGTPPRVNRGGGWHGDSGFCRAAFRGAFAPSDRHSHLGLRLARVPVGKVLAVTEPANALAFDGDSSYVDIPTLERNAPGPITMEAWVRNLAVQSKQSELLMRIAGKAQCQMHISEQGTFVGLERSPKGSGSSRIVESKEKIRAGNWTHVCYVIDHREVRLFMDGRHDANVSGPFFSEMFDPLKERGSWIGAEYQAKGFYFKGEIAGLRISKTARYDKDFIPAKRFEPDADTLALYHFDEGQGTELKDSSGNNHHGKIVGAKWVKAEGGPPATSEAGWVQLFNGRNLAGWKTHPAGPGQWTVTDGLLTCTGPASNLFTERNDFKDFHCRMELKLNAAGNSGLYLRCPFEKPLSRSYEVQLTNLGKERFGGLYRYPGAGNLRWGNGPVLPADTWLTLEVIARGTHLVTKINGDIVVDLKDVEGHTDSGHLALQHTDEKTVVHVRKIEIKDLSQSVKALPPPIDYALRIEDVAGGSFPSLTLPGTGPFTVETYFTPQKNALGRLFWVAYQFNLELGKDMRLNLIAKGVTPKGERDQMASVRTPFALLPGKKYHVAAIRTKGEFQLYIDGKRAAVGGAVFAPVGLFELGKIVGEFDEIRVSKVARYANDFQPAPRFESDADTLALYHCDEGAGAELRDSSGNGHHGKIVGAKWVKVEPAWRSLFNGKDLAGWKTHPDQPGDWKVESGILIGRGLGSQSVLFTEQNDFDDFHLRVEAKLNQDGNSGIFVRSEYGFSDKLKLPKAYEAQISFKHAHKTGSLISGTSLLKGISQSPIQADQWFLLEVIAIGNRIITKVDGKPMVDHVDPDKRYGKGHLGIQAYDSDKDYQTTIQVRNIEIQTAAEGFVGAKWVKAEETPPDDGWVHLFNSKDLTGWKVMGSGPWTVRDGAIVGESASPAGWLMSDKDYGDFELSLEYKLAPKSNSGVFLRAWPEGAVNGGQFMEIQLCDDELVSVDDRKTGAIYAVLAPTPTPKAPTGQWHRLHMRAVGRQLQVTLNDVKIIDTNLDDHKAHFSKFPGLTKAAGRIGLQLYPTQVEFKNIRVRELPRGKSALAPLDNAWLKKVAAMSGKEQAVAVTIKFNELNPGYAGTLKPTFDKAGVIRELKISVRSELSMNFAPLRALTGLQRLDCSGNPNFTDLAPFKDMKLTVLYCEGTKVTELSPLKGMPLKELRCDFNRDRDAEILRSIKTLEKINDKEAKEFWKEVDGK